MLFDFKACNRLLFSHNQVDNNHFRSQHAWLFSETHVFEIKAKNVKFKVVFNVLMIAHTQHTGKQGILICIYI